MDNENLQSEVPKAKGDKKRENILAIAVQLASLEGLEGLTIGRLAKETRMSKSGLFAHFGSKQELQLATIEYARSIFLLEVVEQANAAQEGLPRLHALFSAWLGYVRRPVFEGGCFFAAASCEFDGRPGKVRDRIAAIARCWRELMQQEAVRAKSLGDLTSDANPALIAFQLHAFVQELNWAQQLLEDSKAFQQATHAGETLLRSFATPQGLRKAKHRRIVRAAPLQPKP